MRRFPARTTCSLVVALAVSAPAHGSAADAVPAREAPAAAQPADGQYKGKTAQGYAVKLRIRKGVVQPDVLFKITGTGGCSLTVYLVRATKVKPSGTFKLSSGGMTITGSFVSSTLVKGKISAPSCESAPDSVAYSARRKR